MGLYNVKYKILSDYITYLRDTKKLNKGNDVFLDNDTFILAKNLLKDHKLLEKQKVAGLITKSVKNPLSVQFELTSKCNQSCIHCYNQSGIEKNIDNDDIPFEKWIEVAHELAELPICQTIISGGEPLLVGEKLFQLMDILHSVGVHFLFITNGMLINEDIVKKLSKYDYAWMQFSVDGATENVHDYIRGNKGAFRKVINGICLAKKYGIPVGMASVFMKPNMEQVEQLIDLAYILGVDKMICGEFMYAGRAIKNASNIELSPEELEVISQKVKQKQKKYAGELTIQKVIEPALSLRYRMVQKSFGLLIRPNGEVRIDCQAPIRVGNIMENSFLEIWSEIGKYGWDHKKTLDYIKKIKNYTHLKEVKPRTHFDPDIDLSSCSGVK